MTQIVRLVYPFFTKCSVPQGNFVGGGWGSSFLPHTVKQSKFNTIYVARVKTDKYISVNGVFAKPVFVIYANLKHLGNFTW